MPITERLMTAGAWTLKLKQARPQKLWNAIDQFGHVFVFDTSPVASGMSDASLVAMARWGGVVRNKPTAVDMLGANMIVWLGDEDGKGPLLETAVTKNLTFAGWIPFLLPVAVTAGTITAGGTVVNSTYGGLAIGQTPVSPRQAIDSLAAICGFEYRVNKNFSFDADVVGGTGLFKQTPTAIAVRRSSGRDLSITGLPVTKLDVAIDSEEYFVRAVVQDATGAWTAAAGGAVPYKDGLGNTLKMTKPIVSSSTPAANAAALAANLVAAGQALRQQVILGSDLFDIDRDVVVGDYIYVYDEISNLVDTTNPVRYRGDIIYPVKVRTLAITWPFESGLSVWYRDLNANWTDLTPYMAWEPSGVSFEVGAVMRPLLTKP